jgi:type I restriction enzyme, S subunit
MVTQTKTTWRKVRAEDICKRVTDGTHDTPQRLKQGYPLITSKQLTGGRISATDYFINKKDFDEVNKRSKVDQWDILFGMIGTIGEMVIVQDKNPQFAIKNIGLFKTGENKVLSKWLYYYFKSPTGKAYIKSVTRGTSQGYVPLESLRDFPVLITDNKKERGKIITILSAFDDKIELNNKINRNLEQMAQAIFKEWFVKNQKSKAKSQKLGDLVVLRKDKFKKYEDWKNLKLLDLGRFPQKSLAITSYGKGKEIKTAGISFKKGDILFGAVRPYFHKVVIAPFDGVTNSSVFVIIPKKANNYALLVTILFSENTVNYASMSASGTKMPVIKWEDLCDMEIPLPEEKVLNNFNKIVENFYKVIVKNAEENQKLASLRDLLLPKLMSGEIRV